MTDFARNIYDGILNIKLFRKYFGFKKSKNEIFPIVGFLTPEKKNSLEKALGIKIKKIGYFEQSLTHRSYLPILNNNFLSNERLEFLGDSILGMITSEHLFASYSDVFEGELTKMRSWLVNKNSLKMCSKVLHIDDFLMVSHSASKSLEHGGDSILADALEAILAAIYLDSGIKEARNFVINTMLPIMLNQSVMVDTNYKSILLENVQSLGKESPKYVVINEDGPDHDKEFTIGVYVDENLVGTGKGKSKKQAEQIAAYEALDHLKFNDNKSPLSSNDNVGSNEDETNNNNN